MAASENPPIPLHRAWAAHLAPLGLVALDSQGRILYANTRAAELLGVADPEELTGVDARSFHPVPEVALATLHDQMEATGPALQGATLELRRPDGSPLAVRIHATLLSEAPGGAAVVAALEDVGRQQAVEEGASRSRTMAAVGRLAGGMAHHFNNLLGSILANASLVTDTLPGDASAREELAQIAAAARRASEIADLLLIVSGKEVAPRDEVNLASWVYAAAGPLRERLPEDVELVVRAEAGPLPVRVDPARLTQAVQHLVTNAEEALAGGGTILVEAGTVDLAGAEGEPAFVPPAPAGRYVRLDVGDDGLGMNQDTLARVLEPFFSTRRDREGAGLGLPLVYGIVARAGGHLSVESAPVVGTRVRLLFPFARMAASLPDAETPLAAEGWDGAEAAHEDAPTAPFADAPPPPVSRPQPAPLFGGDGSARPHATSRSAAAGDPPVLVVDDEESIRAVMAKVLERAGHRVLTAVNGRDAQRVFQEQGGHLSLLVTDVMMPELNGVELAAWVRERVPGLPVLLVSGFAESPLVQGWVDREPEAFLAKPFEPLDLLDRVRTILGAAVQG